MTIIDLREPAQDNAQDTVTITQPVGVNPARLRAAAAVAIATVAVLNLADVLTTRAMLARGAIESNPLSALLLPNGRVELIKAAIVGLLAFRVLKRPTTITLTAALWFGAGFYFLTVVSNLLILQRLG